MWQIRFGTGRRGGAGGQWGCKAALRVVSAWGCVGAVYNVTGAAAGIGFNA